MINYTEKRVKLNHKVLLQENLAFINDMANMEEEVCDKYDHKGNAVNSLIRESKRLSEQEKLEKAKDYWQSWKLDDFHSSCQITSDNNEEYECLLDASNKDERFPKFIREINYPEETRWCKLRNHKSQNPVVDFFYIEKRLLLLVE